MDLGLRGKLALVTASSRGLGYASARALALEGADIILSSRDPGRLRRAAGRLREEVGGNVSIHYHILDLTSRESIDELFDWIKDEYGRLDIMVYSTGGPKPGKFMEMEWDDWVEATRLLSLSATWVARRAAELMIPHRWGRMVFIASVAIREPWPDLALSNIMRLPIAGIVRMLAKELGPYGITVNGVMPSVILTSRVMEIAEKRAKTQGRRVEDVLREMSERIPLKRLGKPEELGWLVAFLASEKAGFINGAMIPVDGGLLNSVF